MPRQTMAMVAQYRTVSPVCRRELEAGRRCPVVESILPLDLPRRHVNQSFPRNYDARLTHLDAVRQIYYGMEVKLSGRAGYFLSNQLSLRLPNAMGSGGRLGADQRTPFSITRRTFLS